jgi:hypothetical protein
MSDKYIHIWNESENVSRISLEKLGLSSKRNDPSTIGQFGSGAKFAPIAALRKGLNWIYAGEDSNGQYIMKYTKVIEDGVECIAYDYGDYVKPSSFTLDAGVISWNNDFQIYREAIANAMDEGVKGKQWGYDIVSEESIGFKSGIFSVYITASPGLMEVHNNFDKYFLTNRTKVYDFENVSFYPKADESLRIYNHGVLIYSDSRCKSMYDYNMDGLVLNEERTIRSLWDFEHALTMAILRSNDNDFIKSYIEADFDGSLSELAESKKLNSVFINKDYVSSNWSRCFESMFPSNSVIYDKQGLLIGVETSIKLRGFNPVLIKSDILYSILSSAGVKTYDSVLTEEYKFDIDYHCHSYMNVAKALEVARSFEPGLSYFIENRQIGIFTSDIDSNLGLTINMNKPAQDRTILLNKIHVNDPVESIVATIIHEYDHATTGFTDGNNLGRQFRDLADKRIGKLMMDNFKQTIHHLVDGVVEFSLDKLFVLNGNLNWMITKSTMPGKLILSVGPCIIFINDTAKYNDQPITETIYGLLSVNSTGSALCIDSLSNVNQAINC